MRAFIVEVDGEIGGVAITNDSNAEELHRRLVEANHQNIFAIRNLVSEADPEDLVAYVQSENDELKKAIEGDE